MRDYTALIIDYNNNLSTYRNIYQKDTLNRNGSQSFTADNNFIPLIIMVDVASNDIQKHG